MLLRIAGLVLFAVSAVAANYSAAKVNVDGVEIVRLSDSARAMEVSIAPWFGNNAYDFRVKGRRVIWSPFSSPAEMKKKPAQMGNPFLAPWANRIDGDAYQANGKKYVLNGELKNFRRDANQLPIHGLIVYAEWEVTSVKADANSAEVTSRLEFWRNPDWMAQFPFAHTLWMTYRLRDGELEVQTAIENHSRESMPLVIGFHTYYQLEGVPRDRWSVHIPARKQVELSKILVPTGELKPLALPSPLPLAGRQLDDVFTDLVRDNRGRAEFRLEAKEQKLVVLFGPKYTVGVVWAPPGREFMCFEPMTAPTNGFNLAHQGKWAGLQSVEPGQRWQESFWIRPAQ